MPCRTCSRFLARATVLTRSARGIPPEPGSHYIVAAGTTIYASLRRVFWSDHNEIDFTNHGTIWNIAPGDPSYGGSAVAGFYLYNIVNTGTIIVEAPVGNASAIFNGSLGNTVNNSGSIYAIANGNAEAITHWSPDVVITNSGLIVAYAPSATPGTGGGGVGSALAIWLVNDGVVHNLAGGRILAEGLWATAVNLGRGDLFGAQTIRNDGLIEAYSLTPGRPSYGIVAGGDAHFTHRFDNTGIVRADIVWSSYSPPSVYYGYAAKAPDTIVNETGGQLIGDIETGFGADQVINRGMIDGDVRLGDESDVFNTEQGSFAGVADLGWHDDFFRGSAGSDIAKGNRGWDELTGNGGNDLLLGGVGRDVLIGGAGNDALYGEYGNDRIEVEGGDNAFGGDGNDLVVANDLTFRLIDGGTGADTLRLAVGARNLDLGAAIASGRLRSIEHIELQSGQQLAVRAGNVAALAGGALDISGASANQVHLVGGWTEGAAVVRGGETWRSFTLAGENVFVTGGISVLAGAAEPGFAGLDAVAAGDAPLPAGAELSSNVLNITYYDVHATTVIEAEEVWQGSNAPVIVAYGPFTLVNHGMILMTANNVIGYFFAAVQAQSLSKCENSGTIRTVATGNNESAAYSAPAPLENTGLIEAIAVGGQAQACQVTYGFVNHGAIVARSQTALAYGVVFNGGGAALNTGSIEATGGAGTIGLRLGGGPFINEGTILAQNTAISGARDALAVLLYQGPLDNRGTITGVVAIRSDVLADVVTNSGRITGDILMNAGDDRLTNNGKIVGTIDLGEGDDVYDGAGATAAAVVTAGAGNDTLKGGAFADLLSGGAGNDTLIGGGGYDLLYGGAGADTFAFASVAHSPLHAIRSDGAKFFPDLVADFVSGEDKIDLSGMDAIAGTAANDAFTSIGAAVFSHHAGELRMYLENGRIQIAGDVDGDGLADFQITVAAPILVADIVL